MATIKFATSLAAILLFCTNLFAQDSTAANALAGTAFQPPVLIDSLPQANVLTLKDTAQAGTAKPIAPKPISLRSVLIPVGMISYGALTFGSKDLKNFNLSLRREIWEENQPTPTGFDDYSKYIPAIAVYGLNLVGVKGKHNLLDRTMLYGFSNLIGSGIVSSTKRLTNVVRPDSSNRLSFPSGHTAGAFIAAEFLRQEYKHRSPWYGVAAYAVAAGTGYLRMRNNKHWFNDVVAGAGIGILSTRISYWLYPKLKNAVFKNKNSNTVFAPTYQNGAVGIGLVHQF